MKYTYKQIKVHAMYIVLNKLFFDKSLPNVTVALIPCKRYADVNVENNILFVDLFSDLEDYELIGFILFEMCQLHAFNGQYRSRADIAIALASILDQVGFYIVDNEIKVSERFNPTDAEYTEIEKDILFTIKDMSECLDI
tara:strand:+ start:476 stop:895 length:420 start_codon:yes stop_codon:yes gene_type:complete